MAYSRSASHTLLALLSLLMIGCGATPSALSQPTAIPYLTSMPGLFSTPEPVSTLPSVVAPPVILTGESGLIEAGQRALQLAEAGVTRNTDWTPYVEELGGVAMALVPAGCFMMGSTDEQLEGAFQGCEEDMEAGQCDRACFENEQPVHPVCFEEPFWIDVTEVTNSQFETLGGQATSPGQWPDADHPRGDVTWAEAAEFCQKRDARLLTEAEWEYAARGPDGLAFPWGNQFIADNVVYSESSEGQPWAAQAAGRVEHPGRGRLTLAATSGSGWLTGMGIIYQNNRSIQ